jgi:predicted nucleic acid-binding protein
MRKIFPGHFRPTDDEFKALWESCIFAFDANVLLNLYRYSPETREALEKTMESVKDRLFIPHQVAKEFLNNRLGVTASQAEEYSKVVKKLDDLTTSLTSKKKPPYLTGEELGQFTELSPRIKAQLEAQKDLLHNRLTNDEILNFVESVCSGKTGNGYDDKTLQAIATEGELRYKNNVPPGYKDVNKEAPGDPFRKYGDLIVWKQIIDKSLELKKSIIFVTDDKKEDWWSEQSGRVIGPRAELREEFIGTTSNELWMYTVDKFIEQTAAASNIEISKEALDEIINVSGDVFLELIPDEVEEPSVSQKPRRRLTKDSVLSDLSECIRRNGSIDGSVATNIFVHGYMGSQGYPTNLIYNVLRRLEVMGYIKFLIDAREDMREEMIESRIQLVNFDLV